MRFLGKKVISSVFVFTAFLFLLNTAHSALPSHNSIPGGVAIVPLSDYTNTKPIIYFGQNQVYVVSEDSIWFAVIGLSQDILPGKYLITVLNEDNSQYKRSFRVYPLPALEEQRTITLPENLESLEIKNLDESEIDKLSKASNKYVTNNTPNFNFRQVVNSGSYVPYGRVLQSSVSRTLTDHPWITYITSPNEIVRSPGNGLVEQIYLSDSSGISVVIDHGNGLRSVLNHIAETILKTGEEIYIGDPVGTAQKLESDKTGRVDWHLLLNGISIDPLQFTPSS
jgi:murein DD-endopeptidase MepM/ murein hydrolase activator NlpD